MASAASSASNNVIDGQFSAGTIASSDVSAMTIEFLRARLLSERAASKSARQQVQQLSQKVSELQARLDVEVEQRKRAQDSMERMLKYMRAKGLPAAECLEKAETAELESIKEVDEHGTASEGSITKHQVISSPHSGGCNQNSVVQPSIGSFADDFTRNNNSKECDCTEEPHHSGSILNGQPQYSSSSSSVAEVCPDNKAVENRARDGTLEPVTEGTSDRLESALKLRSIVHQIVKEINMLPPKGELLKSQLSNSADNAINLCGDKPDRGELAPSSHHHREEGKQQSSTSLNLKIRGMQAARSQPSQDTQSANCQGKEMTADALEARFYSNVDVQYDPIPRSVSGQVPCHESTTDYSRGRWLFSVEAQQQSGKPHHFVPGRHYMCSTDRQELWWSPRKPTVGHDMMDSNFYRTTQDVAYSNSEMHHDYVYDSSVDVWHQGRVNVVMSNARRGHHSSLIDDKKGRLRNILNALQEARQYVDDDGRTEHPHIGGSCASDVADDDELYYRRSGLNPRKNSAGSIHHLPSSPTSEHGAAPLLDSRHEGLRRSRSVSSSSANFTSVDRRNLLQLQPTREVQLGNGITLYTD